MHNHKFSILVKSKMTFIMISLYLAGTCLAADTWIEKTIDLTINTDFVQALQTVKNQIDHDSTDYRAWFYLAATYNSKMTHFENDTDADLFNHAIDQTIYLIENKQESETDIPDPLQAQLLFYLGSAYGYRAYFQGRQGQFISAVSNGLKSVGYLNESLEKDSTLYGAYLGIGVYKYWRYSRLSFITWLPIIPDDRDEAIAMIGLAIANDSLSKYMAMHQLIYILLDFNRTEEALKLAEIVVEKYPDSQFMWWANAHAYFKHGDFQKAENSYKRLYELIWNDKNKNISHLLKCQFKRALIAKNQDNFNLCIKRCQEILNYADDPELNGDSEEILSEAENLQAECRKILSSRANGN